MKLDKLMICAAGIPGAGKSSVFQELKYLLQASVSFSEPEEDDSLTPWPKAVSDREKYGYFGAISWFRSMRVPILYDAKQVEYDFQRRVDGEYKSKYFEYFKHRSLTYIILAVCITYLICGGLSGIIAYVLSLVNV